MYQPSHCRRCGHPSNEPYPTPLSGSSSLEESYVLERVQQLEEVIRQLNQERTTLLQRRNTLSASTEALPDDVLSTIFLYTYPPVDFKDRHFDTSPLTYLDDTHRRIAKYPLSQLSIGAVSSHWRRVACSTPYLWTSLALNVKSWNVHQCASIMMLFLQNARGMPFSLELDFRQQEKSIGRGSWASTTRPRGVDPDVNLELIQDILFSHSPDRFKILRLVAPPLEWVHLLSTKFTTLEDLSLGWPSTFRSSAVQSFESFPLTVIPHLQRLSFNTLPFRRDVPIETNWSIITDMTLENIDYIQSLQIMLLCKNARSFRCRSPGYVRNNGDFPIVSSLPQLEHFEWTVLSAGPNVIHLNDTLLQHLELPSLRTLVLKNAFTISRLHIHAIAMEHFFSRLPTSLVSLSLIFNFGHSTVVPIFAECLSNCLRCIPSLEHLCAEAICPSIVNSISGLLRPSQNPGILPNIRSLQFKQVQSDCIRVHPNPEACVLDVDVILEVFAQRSAHCRSNPGFSLVMEGECYKHNFEGVKKRLKELVGNGFSDLKSVLDGATVDWSIGTSS